MQNVFSSLVATAIVTLTAVSVWGHGGSPMPAAEKPKPKSADRRIASEPTPLVSSEVERLGGLPETPSDVVLIRCAIGDFSVARGIQIGLFDDHGHQVAIANSGTNGLVGFEGLSDEESYEVRTLGDRYAGRVVVSPGKVLNLNVERVMK